MSNEQIKVTLHAESRFMSVYPTANEKYLRDSFERGETLPQLLAAFVCGRLRSDETAQYVLDRGNQGIWVIVGKVAVTFLRLSKLQRQVFGDRDNFKRGNPASSAKRRKPTKGLTPSKRSVVLNIQRQGFHGTTEWAISSDARRAVRELTGLCDGDVTRGLADAFQSMAWVGTKKWGLTCIGDVVFCARKSGHKAHVDIVPNVRAGMVTPIGGDSEGGDGNDK